MMGNVPGIKPITTAGGLLFLAVLISLVSSVVAGPAISLLTVCRRIPGISGCLRCRRSLLTPAGGRPHQQG